MGIAALLCVLIGTFPAHTVYALLPWDADYQPYDVTHVLTQLQLLFFSALAFVWLNLRNMYPPELPSTNLDSDWLYRKFGSGIIVSIYNTAMNIVGTLEARAKGGIKKLINHAYDEDQDQPKGYYARLWPMETMVFWVALLLAGFLWLYYL
jgi:multicomponent Na+:H+ antiporter subunit D